jgi:predicted nucleic acid-binding protein
LASPYLFDANIFIDLGERVYPDDVFKGLWDRLRDAFRDGEILTSHGVLGELKRAKKPHLPWRTLVLNGCRAHAIDEAEERVQLAFAKLAQLVADGHLSRALSQVDLLLLACAEAHGYPIVTRDGPMANACANGRITAKRIHLPDVFRELGWTFS